MAVDFADEAPHDGRMDDRALFRARKAAGFTLDRLAAEVGISQSQLSRFESGKRQPRVRDLEKIAARLNVPVESLIRNGGQVETWRHVESLRPQKSDRVLAFTIEEALQVVGVSGPQASEIAAIVLQVVAANLPGFPGLSQEETTRMILRHLVEKILTRS